ncbi:MAG: DEAD/DEAH box helicase family protein [Candidatus Woesearchaeota archaeon]
MTNPRNLGTRDIPIRLASAITKIVNKKFEDGSFLEEVSPITRDLLKFWNPNGNFAETRKFNFHKGQWQAILNTIYLHEILKINNVQQIYLAINPDLLAEMDLLDIRKEKYNHPSYCIKMATGTGKTWVLNALLIWQYLNAKHHNQERFTKNFLLIAPGIIVYERLLDAYLGKRKEDGTRDFETSDFKKFESLFLPNNYKEEILGFVQSCVSEKDEIGKTTGDGLIAITNWHLLTEKKEKEEPYSIENPSPAVKEILPIIPGTSAGHSLEQLDKQYLKGREIQYLSNLQNLLIFNDEAHHLSEFKKSDEILEKRWQEAILKIKGNKKNFIQIDFSATPYSVTGSGQKRTKNYFPNIIVNFELTEAIRQGLVKTVAIDKRKEITAIPLDYKAERDFGNISLSDGQRIMIRAGLTKLKILEEGFLKIDKQKYPKMLIMCEDTKVVPIVTQFLTQEGIPIEDIIEIHSNKEGEIGTEEWEKIKQKLFEIDKHEKPKIIISVLMLREGFDVNNICVIVPLRSSSSFILLEQTIGRGLRIMWREPQYQESKKENREKLLIKKEEPDNYMDILSIIEHPNFIEYYEKELIGAIGETKTLPNKEHVVGDIILVNLKEDYQKYDLFWPIIIHEKEEWLSNPKLTLDNLEPFPIPLEQLKPFVVKEGDTFYGEELTVKTRFGEYQVRADILNAKNYNTFLQKIVNAVSYLPIKLGKKSKTYPIMQINNSFIAQLVDEYIRKKLFNQDFDPLKEQNFKILILTQERVTKHILKNVSQVIYDLQNNLNIIDAKVIKKYFSEIKEIKLRENYSIDVSKSIYPKISFPSNKGGFEKAFIDFIDRDSKVYSFIKIMEHYHEFANIIYIREDGLLAHYFPDFILRIGDNIFIVETKAEKDLNNENVKQKRLATIDWIDKINELKPEDRNFCKWHYVLLGEHIFYSFKEKGATTEEILEYAKMTKAKIKGTLSDFTGDKEY